MNHQEILAACRALDPTRTYSATVSVLALPTFPESTQTDCSLYVNPSPRDGKPLLITGVSLDACLEGYREILNQKEA